MEASLGDHVDRATEELLDPIAELDERESPVPRDVVDEQIDVAVRTGLADTDTGPAGHSDGRSGGLMGDDGRNGPFAGQRPRRPRDVIRAAAPPPSIS